MASLATEQSRFRCQILNRYEKQMDEMCRQYVETHRELQQIRRVLACWQDNENATSA